MRRTLVFTDAHKVGEDSYAQLCDIAKSEKVGNVAFLGDVDLAENILNLRDMLHFLKTRGIMVYRVRGNHCQAWNDYVLTGETPEIISQGDSDLSGIHRSVFLSDMSRIPEEVKLDDLVFTHALPAGFVLSGPKGARIEQSKDFDPRFKHPGLWNYSFNTHTEEGEPRPTVGEGMESYDPVVIQANFDFLSGKIGPRDQHNRPIYRGKILIKGHEHIPKVWDSNKPLDGSNGLIRKPGDVVTLTEPAIVTVGAFADGHYAILDYGSGNLQVSFKHLDRGGTD